LISNFAKRTLIYSEFDKDENNRYFDYKSKKFIHNIDSLYYSVKVKNDWSYDQGVQLFLTFLDGYREQALKSFEPLVLFQNDEKLSVLGTEFIMNGIGFKPYTYDIQKVDKYTMFIMGYELNKDTPHILLQLRSQNLWLEGEYKAVEESIKDLEKILSIFGIEIESVQENRIDYAYHTNYIQDPTNFFQPKNFNRMQKSRFKDWSVRGEFKGEFEVETDYLTFGSLKSNNVFLRIYDKTKEVIEQGYKQFFIKIWYLENMISYFDMYCIEKAFLHPSNTNYDYLDVARLEFYLEYGKDEKIKSEIKDLITVKAVDHEAVRKFADKIVPRVTIITNVELQTKRKYYYSMDSSVENLLRVYSKNVPDYARKLYLKLDNKQLFHDDLVCNNDKQQGIIRFLNFRATNKNGTGWTKKAKFPTADWWTRLQKVKLKRDFKIEEVKLLREYQKTLSAEILKKRITNQIATYSLYLHGEDVRNNMYMDAADYISSLSENDLEKAVEYKRKKMPLIQNRLGSVEGVSKLEKTFRLYDPETGQLF
jgi:hypothetical protein